MENNNTEAFSNAIKYIKQHMNPVYGITENADQYIPLYCYTATTSYALGLTVQERQSVLLELRKLFDFFYDLTIEKTGRFHAKWEEYVHSTTDPVHLLTAMLHRNKAANFTEGNTFVCIGVPAGSYFDDKEVGHEFGEITYAIYGMYNFLKLHTNYEDLFNSELQKASCLYKEIISNPNNRRVYLKMRLKKTDIAFLSDAINEANKATVEAVDEKVQYICDFLLRFPETSFESAADYSVALNTGFQFARPLGNCKYELFEGIEEFNDVAFEKKLASSYILLKSYESYGK